MNATGAEILGRTPATLIGSTLAEAFLDDETNDALMDAILAAIAEDRGTVKTVVDFRRNGELRRLAVASSGYRARSGPFAGQLGVVVTFNDVTEMLRLRAAEAALEQQVAADHAKLRAAYGQLEDAAERERRVSKRARLIRRVAMLASAALFVGIGLYNWRALGVPAAPADGAPEANPGTFTVVPSAVTSRVSVVGAVDAGQVVSIVAPFDGPIQDKRFDYGGGVERGQILVTLDVADLQSRLRDAESARIKARQHVDELHGWANGLEASRARRALATAEQDGANLTTKLAQTKMLLSKGIVAADEYDQLVQQQHTQAMQLQAAREDLDDTLRRGNAENQRVADFELLNAEGKLADLQRDLANATVSAPVSGVVLQPQETEGKRSDMLAAGSRVVRGQTMFMIGNLESYVIRAKVDEIDIDKIRVGQRALVTGDAFDDLSLDGAVTSVAAQASGESTTHSGMATFPITVRIGDLTPEQRARVHVGMSATVSIIAYDNPAALVVPPKALTEAGGQRMVTVRREGHSETRPVILGISTPDGVEIRDGLKAGDVVELGQ